MNRTIALLLAATIALTTGCSRYTLTSAPIWDSESHPPQGPVENRVNLWPIVYWRDPALSVLWPFYTATEQGNALMPLYEYRKDELMLRLITIHPDFPSAATFNSEKRYTRVLNTVVDANNKHLAFFPLYWQNYGPKPWELLLPVYFHNENGVWTPIVTWRDNLKGVLGPVFCQYRDQYYAPWPLVAWWADNTVQHAHAFPLFYYNHKGVYYLEYTMAGLIGRDDASQWVFPLWIHKNDGGNYNIFLAGLGGVTKGDNRSASWLIPLWFSHTEGNESEFLSLPYNRVSRSNRIVENALFNGYVSITHGKDQYRSVLWPIAHQWDKHYSSGNSILPFYMYSTANGIDSFYSPLVSMKSDGSLKNFGLILYHESNARGKHYASALWPVAQWWGDDKGASGRMVLPLCYESKTPGKHTIITPVGASSRGGDLEYTNILGPLYYDRAKPSAKKRYRTVMFPLWHEYDKGDDHTKALAPIALWESDGKGRQFMSPFYSRGVWSDSQYTNVGMFLFDRRDNESKTGTSVLWPIVHWSSRHDGSQQSWRVFPVAGYTLDKDYRKFSSLLNSTWHTRRTDDELRDEIRLDALNEKNFIHRRIKSRGEDAPHEEWNFERRAADDSYLLGLAGHTRNITGYSEGGPANLVLGESYETWFFPLFNNRSDGKTAHFNILFRLFDTYSEKKNNEEVYTRRRVLWRLYHRETLGPKTSIDVFPFITSDSDTKADTSNFSFCWKLFAYDRKGNDHTTTLFFIPIKY